MQWLLAASFKVNYCHAERKTFTSRPAGSIYVFFYDSMTKRLNSVCQVSGLRYHGYDKEDSKLRELQAVASCYLIGRSKEAATAPPNQILFNFTGYPENLAKVQDQYPSE